MKAESEMKESYCTLQALRDELKESKTRETTDAMKIERLLTERDNAENRARTSGSEVIDSRRRVAERDEKYILVITHG